MWLRAQARKPGTRPLPEDIGVVEPARESREASFRIDALISRLPEGLGAAAVLCFEDELSPSAAAARASGGLELGPRDMNFEPFEQLPMRYPGGREALPLAHAEPGDAHPFPVGEGQQRHVQSRPHGTEV